MREYLEIRIAIAYNEVDFRARTSRDRELLRFGRVEGGEFVLNGDSETAEEFFRTFRPENQRISLKGVITDAYESYARILEGKAAELKKSC